MFYRKTNNKIQNKVSRLFCTLAALSAIVKVKGYSRSVLIILVLMPITVFAVA